MFLQTLAQNINIATYLSRFPFITFMLINCFFMQLTHSLICCYYCYYHLVFFVSFFFIRIRSSFFIPALWCDVMSMMMLLLISCSIQAVNGRWPLLEKGIITAQKQKQNKSKTRMELNHMDRCEWNRTNMFLLQLKNCDEFNFIRPIWILLRYVQSLVVKLKVMIASVIATCYAPAHLLLLHWQWNLHRQRFDMQPQYFCLPLSLVIFRFWNRQKKIDQEMYFNLKLHIEHHFIFLIYFVAGSYWNKKRSHFRISFSKKKKMNTTLTVIHLSV